MQDVITVADVLCKDCRFPATLDEKGLCSTCRLPEPQPYRMPWLGIGVLVLGITLSVIVVAYVAKR